VCVYFLLLFIFKHLQKRNIYVMFLGGMEAFTLMYFAKIWGLHVCKIGVCGYGYISMDIHGKSVDMDIDSPQKLVFGLSNITYHGRPPSTYCLATIPHDWHSWVLNGPSGHLKSMIFVSSEKAYATFIGRISHRLATTHAWQTTNKQTTRRRQTYRTKGPL